jgi:hypothetical protein
VAFIYKCNNHALGARLRGTFDRLELAALADFDLSAMLARITGRQCKPPDEPSETQPMRCLLYELV